MSKIKKLIALTLALAMVLSVSAFAGYKVDTYVDAADIDEDCVGAVELLYALDIMKGDNNKFRPNDTITRAEVAKMIYVILNYGEDDKAVNYTGGKFFSDVEEGAWYEGYVNYMASTKLVQGRGDGTFGPNAKITTAEVAKMLLTAIGYSAADRGYTGEKWAENVLSDAAIIGLLDGYNTNVNTTAPRQWVAVMFENALTDALTYATIRPTINGLLTNTSDTLNSAAYPTMGLKYYGLSSFKGVAFATEDALIDGDELASDDTVLFCTDVDEQDADDFIEIKETDLKAADLGQKYKVIYNVKNMEAYSVRSLAEVAEARVYDMEVDIKHATSSNKPANKYVFTIGDIEATLAGGDAKFLTSEGLNEVDGEDVIDAEMLYDLIEDGNYSANTLKAIDSEGDGDIDYFYITTYYYGYVTEVATSNKYGKYINVVKPGSEGDEDDYEYITFSEDEDENLYLKDVVITDDEIEEEDIVKISNDIESGKFVIEVLPAAKGVEYEEYDDKNDIFVLDGKEYYIAEDEADLDWDETCEKYLLDEDYLGEKLNIVYDGDLIVYVWEDDDSYDNMDKVNEQLVLVIDANREFSNQTIHEKMAITYMDIKGDVYTKVYQDGSGVAFDDIEDLIDVEDDTKYDDDEEDYEEGTYLVEGRLFKLKSGTKGRVYLEKLVTNDEADDEWNINEQLSVKTSVLNGFEETEDHLDATGKTITYGDYKVDADNKYFVGSFNSNGEAVYKVMTLDELKNCEDEEAYGQILTLTNAKGTRTTVVGGYIFMDLTSDTDGGYLYIEKIGKINKDGRKVDVVFDDGSKKSIVVDEDASSDPLVEDVLYTYNYNFMDDEYTLTVVELGDQVDEIVEYDDDGYLWVSKDGAAATKKMEDELEDEVVAIITIEVDRDQTQVENEDDDPEFELIVKGIEFVALKDLETKMIENDVDDKTYTQYTDYRLDAEDLFYVANFQIMDTAQEIDDTLCEQLEDIFAAVLEGEKAFLAQ